MCTEQSWHSLSVSLCFVTFHPEYGDESGFQTILEDFVKFRCIHKEDINNLGTDDVAGIEE